jgi:flavin reductase (DIM6/NTAB) family NADH-FMN oxidoreductase RutF
MHEDFQALISGIDYPMFIVTTSAASERAGCLVGFVTQASIDPPRLLVLLSKANRTLGVAEKADMLVIHFLGSDDHDLAALFGEQTGDEVDKFAACAWHEGPGGAPVVEGTRGWAAGPILARLDAGDHVAHLVDVRQAETDVGAGQLGFQAVRDLQPGHPA